ncbi:MAG: hypothetical protein LIP09_12345 [Bacteroidales bacterium]|nr:hypothetical protein [Bacteroidales bacterium]
MNIGLWAVSQEPQPDILLLFYKIDFYYLCSLILFLLSILTIQRPFFLMFHFSISPTLAQPLLHLWDSQLTQFNPLRTHVKGALRQHRIFLARSSLKKFQRRP